MQSKKKKNKKFHREQAKELISLTYELISLIHKEQTYTT